MQKKGPTNWTVAKPTYHTSVRGFMPFPAILCGFRIRSKCFQTSEVMGRLLFIVPLNRLSLLRQFVLGEGGVLFVSISEPDTGSQSFHVSSHPCFIHLLFSLFLPCQSVQHAWCPRTVRRMTKLFGAKKL